MSRPLIISRRAAVFGLTAVGATHAATGRLGAAAKASASTYSLSARTGQARLLASGNVATNIWGYNGRVPGPVLRVKQGEMLRVRFENALSEQATSVHWHGIRIVNAMDGVPGLTQRAVEPGLSFDYAFVCPDAGTYWYHPHKFSSEQVARGLRGILIVEEPKPPKVDQDFVLAFDDWRLTRAGQIHAESFGSIGERAHGGRYGNTFTLNGTTAYTLPVTSGQRLRLRLCNVSNANFFAARFAEHEPTVIAVDGQPVSPHAPTDGFIVLAPGQRTDVIADMKAKPGTRTAINLVTFNEVHTVGTIAYHESAQVPTSPSLEPVVLPANPLNTKLDLENGQAVDLVMEGGAMGGMAGARVKGEWFGMRELVNRHGYVWSFNGQAGMPDQPLLRAKQGQTVKLRMVNRTAWPHAMHLHGHHFKQIDAPRDRSPDPHWRDTIVVPSGEELTMAFVADNPGKWMLHCHMLEHQEGGMATWFEVA